MKSAKEVFENYEETVQNSMIRQLIQHRIDAKLEDVLRNDQTYQKLNESVRKRMEEIEKSNFTVEQWKLIDEVLSENNERNSEYGRIAYQQGIIDALDFLREIMLLLTGNLDL